MFRCLYFRLSEPDSWSIFYARRYVRKLGIRYLTSANRLTPRLDSTSSVDRTRRVISLDRRGLRDYSCSTVPNARIEQFGRIADSASPTLVTKSAERLSNDYRSPARGPAARSRVMVQKSDSTSRNLRVLLRVAQTRDILRRQSAAGGRAQRLGRSIKLFCHHEGAWGLSNHFAPCSLFRGARLRSRLTSLERFEGSKIPLPLAHENETLISAVFAAASSWFGSSPSLQFPRSRIAGPMTAIAPYTVSSPSTGAPIAVTPR